MEKNEMELVWKMTILKNMSSISFQRTLKKFHFQKMRTITDPILKKKSYQTFIFMNGCGGDIVVCSFGLYSSDPI